LSLRAASQLIHLGLGHPQHWRDSQRLEHVLGRYIISDQPMTEEEWARERATVIDDEPDAVEDKRSTGRQGLSEG
jgi:hypothetical protein